MARSCIIIGGGIAGATAALTLSELGIQCSIYEVRDQPATIGGSVDLTPSALRLLENIGVRLAHGCVVDAIEVFSLSTGSKLGELPFRKSGHALRIMRENLQEALLEAVKVAGIVVQYGSKLSSIEDVAGSPKITAVFSNGYRAEAEFVLGCDGVHSAVRTSYVEPGRRSIFGGVAAAYALVDADGVPPLHFQTTAATSGRFGTMLTSFIEEDRMKIFLTATMTAIEKKDKWEGKTRGENTKATMEEVRRRYQDSVLPCIMPLVDKVDEFVFYPVYTLGSGGIWSKGRVLLLGDAAHCMPPQGESTAFAIEDAVLISRVFERFLQGDISRIFMVYEYTRRHRIDKAYKEAVFRWSQVKDKSWLQHKVIEWATSGFLWLKRDAFEASVTYDIKVADLHLNISVTMLINLHAYHV